MLEKEKKYGQLSKEEKSEIVKFLYKCPEKKDAKTKVIINRISKSDRGRIISYMNNLYIDNLYDKNLRDKKNDLISSLDHLISRLKKEEQLEKAEETKKKLQQKIIEIASKTTKKNNIITKKSNTKKISLRSLNNILKKIAPKTWEETQYAFGDIIENHRKEIKSCEEKNLKYTIYLETFWEVVQFLPYFLRTSLINKIKNVIKIEQKIN